MGTPDRVILLESLSHMRDLLRTIQERVLVCDGAMGTMLYSKGVFISRCFEEMNLSNPELVLDLHREYIAAGADIIETNTFGGNRIKLMMHGLVDQDRRINVEGARIAREAAGDGAFVAGAIGPLGIRIEPWGKMGVDEAREIFREQTVALVEGGVDLVILETFSDLNEIRAAILGVRDVTPAPIIAQMTIEENGCSLEGTPPEVFAWKLDQWGADVLGLNCSVGPQTMLDSVERIIGVTRKPLAVQPNAGRPQNIEGRNIYLCSPEYMASYAKRFVQQGVRIVGGCCGTTPQHIRSIRSAVRAMQPGGAPSHAAVSATEVAPKETTIPVADRSSFGAKIARGDFVHLVEMIPSRGHDSTVAIDGARFLKAAGVDLVNLPDAPRSSASMSALSLAVLLEKQTGLETCAHYTCVDRNLLGMQADLLGAYALGLRNLLLITGDPPVTSAYAGATAVYDVDSIGLTNMVHRLNHGVDVGGKSIGEPTGFVIGVGANAGIIRDNDEELRRFAYKVEAGAEFVLTQPIFDIRVLEMFMERVRSFRIPVIAGILPLQSFRTAEFLNNELPGYFVPEPILERMRRAGTAEAARDEGIRIAQELAELFRPMVQGIQIRGPVDYTLAADVLAAGLKGV